MAAFGTDQAQRPKLWSRKTSRLKMLVEDLSLDNAISREAGLGKPWTVSWAG